MAIIEVGLSVYLNTKESAIVYSNYNQNTVNYEPVEKTFCVTDYYKIENPEYASDNYLRSVLFTVTKNYFIDIETDIDKNLFVLKPLEFKGEKYLRLYELPYYLRKDDRKLIMAKYIIDDRLYERKLFYANQELLLNFIQDYSGYPIWSQVDKKHISNFMKTGKLSDLIVKSEHFRIII